ncbi:hypothetical protein LVD17_07035 [Fulvivirga ulvae]|uniref:tetratricopeptide repeat protein n=1 Tax=Fulvivirga ulvae TaxID=2904245 RepID=UPI001F3CDDCC|nr:hypothetical protein [Fulvivirga ulvae]UII33572.1 hypothetical protein LVD17_07035 [Fulvivirga ulvae]
MNPFKLLLTILIGIVINLPECKSYSKEPDTTYSTLYDSILILHKFDREEAFKMLDAVRNQLIKQQDIDAIHQFTYLKAYLHFLDFANDSAAFYLNVLDSEIKKSGIDYNEGNILLLKGMLDTRTYAHKSTHLQQAYQYFLNKNDSTQVIRSLNNMAVRLMSDGDYLSSMRILTSARSFFNQEQASSSYILSNIAHTYMVLGLYERALDVCKTSLVYVDEDESIVELLTISEIYLIQNQTDSAWHYNMLAEKVIEKYPNAYGRSMIYLTQGNILLARLKPEKALVVFDKIEISDSNYYLKFKQLFGKFQAYKYMNDHKKALKLAKETVNFQYEVSRLSVKQNMEVNNWRYIAYDYLNDYENALAAHEAFFDLYRKIYNLSQVSDIIKNDLDRQHQFEMDKARLEKELLQSAVKRNSEKVYYLTVLLILLIIIFMLLIFRYRSRKKMTLLLEEKVKQRTSELTIRNRQLEEYAFINAHQLRAPVARLLGLAHLANHVQDIYELKSFYHKIEQECLSLDKVVGTITKAIDEKIVLSRDALD